MSELLAKETNQSTFVKRTAKTWIHSDNAMQDGIVYHVKYVGCIGVNESMKSLSFETRTLVARESIRRVAEKAKLLSMPRKIRKNDEQLTRILSNNINTQWSSSNVELHVNTQSLKITDSNDILFQHTMQNISFACGGDAEIQDFVAYVAKDEFNGRACYVFECGDGLANNVITTIGQAFELRFKKFLNSIPNTKSPESDISMPVTPLKEQKSNNFASQLHTQAPYSQHANSSLATTTPTHSNKQTVLHSDKIDIPAKKFNPIEQPVQQASYAHDGLTVTHMHHHVPPPPPTTTTMTAAQQQHHHHHQPQPQPKAPASMTNGNVTTNGHKVDEKLERMSWFHGLMERENAEKLLTKDGDYLVRETRKANRQYVLSGRYKGECRHIFLVDPSGVVRTKDRVFENICHLIKYHQDNNIPIISKDNELLLENPISRK